jgi:hypothetical protein
MPVSRAAAFVSALEALRTDLVHRHTQAKHTHTHTHTHTQQIKERNVKKKKKKNPVFWEKFTCENMQISLKNYGYICTLKFKKNFQLERWLSG